MRFLDTVYELGEDDVDHLEHADHEPQWMHTVWCKNVLSTSGSWVADMERVTDNQDGAEAPRDPGALTSHPSYTDKDFEGHRGQTVYVGLHVPGYRRRASASGPSGHHRRHRHHGKKSSPQGGAAPMQEDKILAPGERIHFLLGEEDEAHDPHPLFSEMEVLTQSPESSDYEWREAARWIKFEENVEEGGDRWSKPHVSTISLHALMDLRSFLLNGTVLLDMEASSLESIAELILENMVNSKQLPMTALDCRDRIKEILLKRHRHQHEKRQTDAKRLPLIRSLADIGRNSSKSMFGNANNSEMDAGATPAPAHAGPLLSVPGASVPACTDQLHGSPSSNSLHAGQHANDSSSPDLQHRLNQAFMRKVPHGSEAVNILVGEVDFLERPIMAFVRLNQAMSLGDLTEVPVPTRFFFLLLGPMGNMARYHEVGRSMGILMTDEVFHDVAFKAKSRDDLLLGIDEFLDSAIVVPPGAWDPDTRIEPPQHAPSQEARKKQESDLTPKINPEEEEEREREECGLKRTGILWGGLMNDIRRKKPWYISDFTDAFSLQSVASIFFLYFACLTPIITFGGLLGSATENRIAAMESLMSGVVCGVVYGLFAGQPLTILGSTGPVLVFETIMYDFCKDTGLDYLSLRFWVGIWTMAILIYLVALDASALVCYITRFTEENFATLISLIFIIEAFKNVGKIGHKMPVNRNLDLRIYCDCLPPANSSMHADSLKNLSQFGCLAAGGEWQGEGCAYVPDVFLLSVVLFAATFLLATTLKSFKFTNYFPTWVRSIISDFAVVIAISSVSFVDLVIGLETPKLNVPEKFEPTWKDRGWLIPPFNTNPWWTVLLAIPPALLACILIFMDQQITAVIVNRKEYKLKKGCGYHLDLLVLAVLIGLCSVFGLPWFVAATVLAMTHVNSLKRESETSAPGEKPQFLGVREQRVTQIMIFVLVGLSVFFTKVLKHIPMPVLYGVFLYMGVSSLQGSQLFSRILILFMPQKYQPDYMFLRSVPTLRVHLFTLIQVLCLASLWIVKSYKSTSIGFPLMLVVMIGIRKCLDFIFTRKELKVLDDIMPEHKRLEEAEKNKSDPNLAGGSNGDGGALEMRMTGGDLGSVSIQLVNGDIMECKEPVPGINISEQLTKTSLWKSIDQQNAIEKEKPIPIIVTESSGGKKKKRGSKKDAVSEEERRRLSTMTEENNDEDEDCGITIKIQSATPIPQSSPQEAKKSFSSPESPKGSETTVGDEPPAV